MDTPKASWLRELTAALSFAAYKHRNGRRKDSEHVPYINHPIAVLNLLVDIGGIVDLRILQAAVRHDTIEDTDTSREELDEQFGREVRQLVDEVTDDKRLPKQERKRLQIEHAPRLSAAAKQIKLADKICNITDVTRSEPADWLIERKREYLDWAEKVVAGCRGINQALEQHFDALLAQKRKLLA